MTRATIWTTLLLLLAGIGMAQAGDISGIWLTEAGDARIRISPCPSGLCAVIVWLKTPVDPATGKPQVDDKNTNKALARRPIIGIDIFSAMRAAGPDKWSGRIYNADDGKTYASHVRLAGAKRLEVRGCVLAVLCGGETWSKVADLPPEPAVTVAAARN
jgi:uncharacterized protein (DUF2147 family)